MALSYSSHNLLLLSSDPPASFLSLFSSSPTSYPSSYPPLTSSARLSRPSILLASLYVPLNFLLPSRYPAHTISSDLPPCNIILCAYVKALQVVNDAAPTDATAIDALAAGLMKLQAAAYSEDQRVFPRGSDEWCEKVWGLERFLNERRTGSLKDAARIVMGITWYGPRKWRQQHYWWRLQQQMKELQQLLINDKEFIADTLRVQLLWMDFLNYHSGINGVSCSYAVVSAYDR